MKIRFRRKIFRIISFILLVNFLACQTLPAQEFQLQEFTGAYQAVKPILETEPSSPEDAFVISPEDDSFQTDDFWKESPLSIPTTERTERYELYEALDFLRADTASAVILENPLTREGLEELFNHAVREGIEIAGLILHGETVLLTLGSGDEIAVSPAGRKILEKASFAFHIHPQELSKNGPTGPDLVAAAEKTHYVLTLQDVYAYNQNGIFETGGRDWFQSHYEEAVQASQVNRDEKQARDDLNLLIAEQDKLNQPTEKRETWLRGGTLSPLPPAGLDISNLTSVSAPFNLSRISSLPDLSRLWDGGLQLSYDVTGGGEDGIRFDFDRLSTSGAERLNLNSFTVLRLAAASTQAQSLIVRFTDDDGSVDSFTLTGLRSSRQFYDIPISSLGAAMDRARIRSIEFVLDGNVLSSAEKAGVLNLWFPDYDGNVATSFQKFDSATTWNNTPSGDYTAWTQEFKDMNGDGLADYVRMYKSTNATNGARVQVALNVGLGFASPTTWHNTPSGDYTAWTHQLIDVNGDGLADYIRMYKNTNGTKVQVALNIGAGFGALNAWQNTPSGNYTGWSHQLTDVNGDGRPDYVRMLKGTTGTRVQVLFNTGSGFGGVNTFHNTPSGDYTAWSHQLTDVNGDGLPDYIRMLKGTNGTRVQVALNVGAGFASPTTWHNTPSGDYTPWTHQLLDINRDGLADYVRLYKGTNGTKIQAAMGTGMGFGPVLALQTTPSGNYTGWSHQLTDINGDGRPDYVRTLKGTTGTRVQVMLNLDAGFEPVIGWQNTPSGDYSAWSHGLVDLNGDSVPDYVRYYKGTNGTRVHVALNQLFTGVTPKLDAPSATTSQSVNFVWPPMAGAKQYEVQESSASNFATISRTFWTSEISETVSLSQEGTYYYRLRSWTALPQLGGLASPFSSTHSVFLDWTAPTGSVSINSGAAYATSQNVTLTLSGSDSVSGVDQMRFSTDQGSAWTTWEAFASSKSLTLPTGDGSKEVQYQLKDKAGNVSTFSDAVILDTAVPSGSVAVNNGDTYTTSPDVSLNLTATDDTSGPSQMRFSTDGGSNWTSWEAVASSKSLTLPSGDGSKEVRYQLKDTAGLTSIFSDTLILDTLAPSGSVFINNNDPYVSSQDVVFTLSFSDGGSGLDAMRFSDDDGQTWSDWEAVGSTKSWTFPAGDGSKKINFELRDKVGFTSTFSDTITLDTVTPSGFVTINSNATYSTSRDVTLSLTSSDETSGPDQMRFSTDGGSNWTAWEAFANSKNLTLPTGDGSKEVQYQLKDKAGNASTFTDTITLDTTLPSGSISINNNAAHTTSTDITLSLTSSDATSGLDQMRFSTDGGTNWTGWEAIASSKSLTLPTGDGSKEVRYQVRDNAGNISTLTDTILLDTTAPTGTISINSNATYTPSRTVTLNLTSSDETSGADQMRFKVGNGAWSNWEAVATSKTLDLEDVQGTQTVYFQVKDALGWVSNIFSDAIILDTVLPSGSVSINSNATYSTSRDVTLSLSSSDDTSGPDQMRFSTDGGSNWTNWEAVATSKSLTLPIGDGSKEVRYQVRDKAGNVSTLTDTIILDTTAPSGTVSINNNAAYTSLLDVTVALSSSDATSGIDAMRFSIDGGSNWSAWEDFATFKSLTLSTGDGTKEVRYQLRDEASNVSTFTDTILLDTTAPTGSVSINQNATYTVSRDVTLTLNSSDATSGLDQMRFSTDGGTNWTAWEAIASSKNLTLPTGDGPKEIQFQIRDNVGLVSTFTDTITLDTVLPSGSVLINSNTTYTTSRDVTLSLTSSDDTSGVDQIRFSTDGGSNWTSWEDFVSSKSLTLPIGDGSKEVRYQVRDEASNVSTFTDTIILDTTAPSGTVKINGNDTYASSIDVTLTLTSSDATSGLDQMRFSTDGGTNWTGWEAVVTSKSLTLPAGDGSKEVRYQIRDNAGLVSTFTDTILLDTVAPTASVTINNNAVYAASRTVSLNLTSSDETSGADQMRFKVGNGAWSNWEAIATSKTLDLEDLQGTQTVYFQVKDTVGWISNTFSDAIILDTVLPSGSVFINSNATYSTSRDVTLSLTSSDATSGPDQMRFSTDGGSNWTAWEAIAASKNLTLPTGDGSKEVRYQVRDNAGLISTFTDTITLDTVSPTGTVKINGTDLYTTSPNVSLTLSSSDATSGLDQMRFSTDSGSSWASWEAIASSKNLTLPTGDGSKEVRYQVRDNAGLISTFTDTITLDTVSPTGTVKINGTDLYTTSPNVSLTLSSSDATSGLDQMRFSTDSGSSWASWEAIASSKNLTLPTGDGSKEVQYQLKDKAGLVATFTDTITLDTVTPSGSVSINSSAIYTTSRDVTLNLSSSDATSGLDQMRFSTDSGSSWASWEAIASSKNLTLPTGDGSKEVQYQLKDKAGLVATFTDTITLDTTAPIGSIFINNDASYATSRTVTLTLSGLDDTSGPSRMRFKVGNGSWLDWESYATTKTLDLEDIQGTQVVHFQVEDGAGLLSGDLTDNIVLDTVLPSGSVAINNNVLYTATRDVTLNLTSSDATSGLDQMRFSTDSGSNWTAWEAIASSKNLTLPTGDGSKEVQYQLRDKAGNTSTFTDTITLDTVTPSGSVSINNNATYSTSRDVTLNLTSSDDTSGLDQMRFSTNSGSSWSGWEAVASSKSLTLPTGDGSKEVRYQLRDNAGNVSTFTDTITLDTSFPSGSVSINSNAAYTTSRDVTLSLTSSDATSGLDKMRFSTDSGSNWTSWEAIATSKNLTLPTGDGSKEVQYQLKDKAGNTSTFTDVIALDTTAPTGSILINNNDANTASRDVTLSLSSSDATSGLDRMRFSIDGGTQWFDWEPIAGSKTLRLPRWDGNKEVKFQLRDVVGHIGTFSDSITLETGAPKIYVTSPAVTKDTNYTLKYIVDGVTKTRAENLNQGNKEYLLAISETDAVGNVTNLNFPVVLDTSLTENPLPGLFKINIDNAIKNAGSTVAVLQEASKKFLSKVSDIYDFLMFIPTKSAWEALSPLMGLSPSHSVMARQPVSDIGFNLGDWRTTFGSSTAGQLRATQYIGSGFSDPLTDMTTADSIHLFNWVLLHEVGHFSLQALNSNGNGQNPLGILDTLKIHWGPFFNADRSAELMADWDDNGNGTFTFTWVGPSTPATYNDFDLYAMGLLTPEEVQPSYIIENPKLTDGRSIIEGTDRYIYVVNPNGSQELLNGFGGFTIGQVIQGTKKTVTMDDIIAIEGLRSPVHPFDQVNFSAAIVVIDDPLANPTEWRKTFSRSNDFMERVPGVWEDSTRNRSGFDFLSAPVSTQLGPEILFLSSTSSSQSNYTLIYSIDGVEKREEVVLQSGKNNFVRTATGTNGKERVASFTVSYGQGGQSQSAQSSSGGGEPSSAGGVFPLPPTVGKASPQATSVKKSPAPVPVPVRTPLIQNAFANRHEWAKALRNLTLRRFKQRRLNFSGFSAENAYNDAHSHERLA